MFSHGKFREDRFVFLERIRDEVFENRNMQFFHSSSPFAGAMNNRTTRESYATVERVLFEEFGGNFLLLQSPKKTSSLTSWRKKNTHTRVNIRRAKEEEEEGERRGREEYGAVEARTSDADLDGINVASQGFVCLACAFESE